MLRSTVGQPAKFRGKAPGNWVRRGTLAIAIAAMCGSAARQGWAAVVQGPEVRIPLEPMGFQPILPQFLLDGQSMLSVDFVDKDHLLVTFGVRRLMSREVDPPPDDDDHSVEAVLVEIPSGRALAKAEWRMHDRGRYLWNLGDGRFLLRVRDQLSLIDPMRGVQTGNAFRETALFHSERHVIAILVSPERDLLTVETTAQPGVVLKSEQGADQAPVQINFYRLADEGEKGLQVRFAGVIRTKAPLELPLTSRGYLDVVQGGNGTWLFNFDEHAGKVDELLAFDTSCYPRSTFVGKGEFVVFGCRGGDDKRDLAAFNLHGDEMWQQNLFESYVTPTFAFAPAAGRFALGRTIVLTGFAESSTLPSTAVSGQEVRVYQVNSGKVLLKIDCTPVARAGQNFALADDGSRIAVIRQATIHHAATKEFEAYTENSTAVEVYALPGLTADDRGAIQKAEASAPPETDARIDVALARVSARETATAVQKELAGITAKDLATQAARDALAADPEVPEKPVADAVQTTAQPTAGVNAAMANEGDVIDEGPRKPPTLYGPDEKAGSGRSNAK